MSEEPAFLDPEQVKILHHIALERHGTCAFFSFRINVRPAMGDFAGYSCHIRAKSFVLDACRCFSLRLLMEQHQSETALVEGSAHNGRLGSSPLLSTTS